MVTCVSKYAERTHMTRTNFFWNKHTISERITQTIGDYKVFCQNKYSTLQRMDDCHSFSDKNRYTNSKGRMASIKTVK